MKDPRRVLSPRVADAHESSPAFEAAMSGAGIVSATWGDLASRIVEAGLVEPDTDAVCGYLQKTKQHLADPEIAISSHNDIYWLREKIEKNSKQEFVETFGNVANEFGAYIDECIAGWKVEDGEHKASKVQEEIDSREAESTDEVSILCLKRDALYSGVETSLSDFVKAVFIEFEGQRFFTNEELAECLDVVVENVIRSYVIQEPKHLLVGSVVIGKDQINDFMQITLDRFNRRSREVAEQRWEPLKPFLYAPEPSDFALLN
jgi:hypothetical protein